MTPASLRTVRIGRKPTPNEREARFRALGPLAARYGRFPKGTVLPETQVVSCPRVKVGDLPEGFLKKNHIERLEHDQTLPSCCRHPERHEVEGRKSHPDEPVTDVYVFYCSCGKRHRFFCVGEKDVRPEWGAI